MLKCNLHTEGAGRIGVVERVPDGSRKMGARKERIFNRNTTGSHCGFRKYCLKASMLPQLSMSDILIYSGISPPPPGFMHFQ
jgi:hypothetical protein